MTGTKWWRPFMAAPSIGMHWTPLFPSHTSWKWCIQVSGCIEPISTPPSLENMHPSSTQCQCFQETHPYISQASNDFPYSFPFELYCFWVWRSNQMSAHYSVYATSPDPTTTTTKPLKAYQQIGHCPHFMCMYTVSISWHSVHIDEWSALAFQSIHWVVKEKK